MTDTAKGKAPWPVGKADLAADEDDMGGAMEEMTIDDAGAAGAASKNKKKAMKKKAKKKAAGGVVLSEFVTLKENEEKGRYTVATKDIEPGTILITERAFVCAFQQLFCSFCANPCGKSGIQCKECVFVEYCSLQCQANHKVLHSRECKLIGPVKDIASEYSVPKLVMLLVVRVLLSKQMQAEGVELHQDDGLKASFAELDALVAHKEAFPAGYCANFAKAFQTLFDKCSLPFSTDDAVRYTCVISVNSHGMEDNVGQGRTIGFGLFPRTAMVCHSCKPNTAFIPSGDVMFVRSVTKIKAGDEITLKYIDPYVPSWLRRNELKSSRYFYCMCPRCQDPNDDLLLAGFVCGSCNSGTFDYGPVTRQLYMDALKNKSNQVQADASIMCTCSDCGVQTSYLNLYNASMHASEVYDKANSLRNEQKYAMALDHLTTKLLNLKSAGETLALHPYHWTLFNAYSCAMNCARAAKDWTSAIKYCKEVLKCMEYRYPTYDSEKVNYYALLSALIRENIQAKADKLTPKIKKALESERQDAKERAIENQKVCRGYDKLPEF